MLEEPSALREPRCWSKRAGATASKKVKELEEKNTSLKLSVDSLEQERDFYFAKLRDIEILCTDASLGNNQVVKAVQTILYATEEYDIAGLIQQAASSPAKAAQEPKTEAAMAATAAAAGEKSAEPAIGDSVTAGTPELAKSADKSIASQPHWNSVGPRKW